MGNETNIVSASTSASSRSSSVTIPQAEMIRQLMDEFDKLRAEVKQLSQEVSSIKIQMQYLMPSNAPIKPGIACKLAYDDKGVILGGYKLDVSDLPTLGIDNITGLREELDELHSKKSQPNSCTSPAASVPPITDKIVVGSGIKVNWNKRGQIVSSADRLLPSDIPELPIDKIRGLSDALSEIEASIIPPVTATLESTIEDSKLLDVQSIGIDDIPQELIIRLNNIESKLASLPDFSFVQGLATSYQSKLDSNPPITPGQYSKLTVDTNGLVTGGSQLTIKDIPGLQNTIDRLEDSLNDKTSRKITNELMDTVSLYTSTLSLTTDALSKLQLSIEYKADDEELKKIQADMLRMQGALDKINDSYPLDMLGEEIENLKSSLISIKTSSSD